MRTGWLKRMTMRGYRRLAVLYIGYVALFVSANYAIWKLRTEVLLTKKYDGGDLARMGYLHGVREYRKKYDDLPLRHLEMKEFRGQPVDMLVIGDSFSNGGGEGRNSYYQDYIASLNNLTVLNVFPYKGSGDLIMGFNPASTLAVLYNSGYLDLIKPKCVLLESAERYSIPRFGLPLNFTATATVEQLREYYRDKDVPLDYLPSVSFINEGNFKYLYYNFLYNFSDHAFRRLVYRKRLTVPLFSVGDGRTLIFHGDEVQNLTLVTPEYVRTMNDNLNRISDLLAEKGIRLSFMPIVDKSNLYHDYLVDHRYPQSGFFEQLRALPRRYTLVDTKKILADRLRRSEKDLFHADDSHWSWRASEAIFREVRFDGCRSGGSAPQPRGEQ